MNLKKSHEQIYLHIIVKFIVIINKKITTAQSEMGTTSLGETQ